MFKVKESVLRETNDNMFFSITNYFNLNFRCIFRSCLILVSFSFWGKTSDTDNLKEERFILAAVSVVSVCDQWAPRQRPGKERGRRKAAQLMGEESC